MGKNCIFNKETGEVRGWNPGQSELPNTHLLKEQFEALVVCEKNLLTEIRERERAFALLLNKMSEERQAQHLKLKKDPNTLSKQAVNLNEKEEENQDQDENDDPNANSQKQNQAKKEEDDDEFSMLASFMPANADKNESLNKEQIDQIKEDCLRSLKERLVERLNIITRRLHSEIECLEAAKTQWENYQNTQMDADNADKHSLDEQSLRESEYKALKKECEFKIKIIKQRLTRHERLSIQRMNKLAQMLDSFPNHM